MCKTWVNWISCVFPSEMFNLCLNFYSLLAVDGAFGSYSEASGGRLASLAYTPRRSLRSPPAWNIKKNRRNTSENKFWWGKNLKPKIFEEKNLEKKSRKFFRNFFFDFPKFFPVEIFHMMSRLRMQNNTIIGQGVPEIWGGTDRQTDSGWGFII